MTGATEAGRAVVNRAEAVTARCGGMRCAEGKPRDIHDFGEAIDTNAPHNRRKTRKVYS